MPTNLEFRNCPSCGKSIPSQARECYRCHAGVLPLTKSYRSAHEDSSETMDREDEDSDGESGTEHGALAHGGYEPESDFDYDEYVKREFDEAHNQRRGFQWYVVWLLIVALAFPLVATFIQLLFGN